MNETLEQAQKLDKTAGKDRKTIEVQAESFSVYAVGYLDSSTSTSHMDSRPEDGVTQKNPFPKGLGKSDSFRIPAMVTLADGTIVAAADARWNTTYDGGGLDTVVFTLHRWRRAPGVTVFVNYLGDNGNVYNGSKSTSFIDPALATDGDTVYLLCDLYPYGVALNGSGNTSPQKVTGFNADGKLRLKKREEPDKDNSYQYYLDGDTIIQKMELQYRDMW